MPDTALTPAEIRNAFRERIPRIPTTYGYRIRLLAVLMGLVGLQLLYLLLVAAVLAATCVVTLAVLGSGMRLNWLTIVIYAAPPATGIITLLFLLKPIIVRPRRGPEPLQVLPQREPALFELVECLCRSLGAPRPSRIFVDLQVNASAGLRGWRGFFLGHVDLTIGMPLATGLDLRQFTGVLAHEFGHFAQRAGLRSYFLIQTIQRWFARVVHERDNWDAWLAGHCDEGDWRVWIIANLASVVVAASRKYLSLLMTAGKWLSSGFSRQMEFDADRYATAIVGPDVLEQTSHRIAVLSFGSALAWDDATSGWRVGQLPGDVAALVSTRAACLPDETASQIVLQSLEQATGRWDTHPSPGDRIASSRSAGYAGVFRLEGPADRAFADILALCQEATAHHYEKFLGIELGAVRFVKTHEAILNARFDAAVQELFHAPAGFCRSWFRLPSADPCERESAGEDAVGLPSDAFDQQTYDEAVTKHLHHFAALRIVEAGAKVALDVFHLPAADIGTVRREEAASASRLRELHEQLNAGAAGIAARIESAAAKLLRGDCSIAASPDSPLPVPDLPAAWRTFGALSSCHDDILEIRKRFVAADVVRRNASVFPAATCANLLDTLEGEALSRMVRVSAATAEAPSVTIFDPLAAGTVGAQLACAKGSAAERIERFLHRADALSGRALGELARFTLAAYSVGEQQPESQPSIETALGPTW